MNKRYHMTTKISHTVIGELRLRQEFNDDTIPRLRMAESYYNHWENRKWEYKIPNGIKRILGDLNNLANNSVNPYFWQNLQVQFEFELSHPLGMVCAWVAREDNLTHVFAFEEVQDMASWNVAYKIQIQYMMFEGGRLLHECVLENHKDILASMAEVEAIDQFGLQREEPIELEYETQWFHCWNGDISVAENIQREFFVPKKS